MEDPLLELFSQVFLIASSFFKSFSPGILTGLLGMIILLVFSALISGSEIAYFSLNPSQLDEIKSDPTSLNKLIIKHLEKPKWLLASILISNNFVNVAIVVLSTYITAGLFWLEANMVLAFVIQVIVVTALILLFGEMMPKILATQEPVKFARLMARPLRMLSGLFYPLNYLLVRTTSLVDKKLSNKGVNISKSDLTEAIEITTDDLTMEEEKKILKGIVKFGDIEVTEIMKSRVDVTAIDSKTDFHSLLSVIVDSGYSRIPVFEQSFDNVLGILYVKDLLPHLGKEEVFDWLSLVRPAFFVPENKRINDLLQEFKEKKIHLAIIVDEYGGTSGIITLEDIIEEIVGEIIDEYDTENNEVSFTRLDDNNYLFEGKTTVNDFCKILDINDEIFDAVKGESDTLAGLILELVGKIPEKAESVEFDRFVFKIEAADDRRITEIKVTIKDEIQ